MSLTRILKRNSKTDIEFKNCILPIVPKVQDLKTLSKNKPFSNEFKMKVPSLLNTLEQASIVGTAFDYLLRFLVAQYLRDKKQKNNAIDNLVCSYAFNKLRNKDIDVTIYIEKYETIINRIKKFIYLEKEDFELYKQIITDTLYLANLEAITRGNPRNIDILTFDDRNIKNQLYFLAEDFKKVFIKGNILKKDSKVIFNPDFGYCSMLVGGADADIVIDGVLYDIKTTKSYKYQWNDIAQITSYYLFEEIERDFKINRIAIYLARYGEVIYYDVEQIDTKIKSETMKKLKKIIKY